MKAKCILLVACLTVPGLASGQPWVHQVHGLFQYRIEATPDGGVVLAGYDRETWPYPLGAVSRLDADGTVAWTWARSPATPGAAHITSHALPLPSGDVFVLAQDYESVGETILAKLDAAGSLLWEGRLSEVSVSLSELAPSPDGGAYLAYTLPIASNPRATVVRFDSDGGVVWARRLNGSSFHQNIVLNATPSGGCLAQFEAESDGVHLVQLDEDGALIQALRIDLGPFSSTAYPTGSFILPDGSLRLVGNIGLGQWAYLWAIDEGELQWERYSPDTLVASATLLSDGRLLMSGHRRDLPAPTRGWFATAAQVGDYLTWKESTQGSFAHANAPDGGAVFIHDVGVTTATVAWLPADLESFEPCWEAVDGLPELETPTLIVPVLEAGGYVADPVAVSLSPVNTGAETLDLQVECSGCTGLSCSFIETDPIPACAGQEATLSIEIAGGEPPILVEWDLDGDGIWELVGETVTATMPEDGGDIFVRVSDSCSFGVQECIRQRRVEPPPVLRPVSDLRVRRTSTAPWSTKGDLSWEPLRSPAGSYAAHVGRIGDWSGDAALSHCPLSELVVGVEPGRLVSFDVLQESNVWVVLAEWDRCGVGPAGEDSLGRERSEQMGWVPCP